MHLLLQSLQSWVSELYSTIHIATRWKRNDRIDIKNTDNTQTKQNSEKQTMQNTAKQNYPSLVACYDTWPGNDVGLFNNATEHTRGEHARTANEFIQEAKLSLG